jgi:hypothetical protein
LGSATTVHRSQAATVGRGPVFADGGGRELAYVAMFRARHSTHIYITADDTAVAVEDLTADWQQERRPRWAIDTGLPPTANAQRQEQHLGQRERANILAIAGHERVGSGGESTRAATSDELERYRARLEAVDPDVARPRARAESEWTYPTVTRARGMGIAI